MMKHHKPIEIDASFLYLCPNNDCRNQHWLFLREVKTKNFKVVCDCGIVFKPKTIKEISVTYLKPKITTKPNKQIKEDTKSNIEIPIDILNQCVTILANYGFSEKESVQMISKAYLKDMLKDPIQLIKLALQSLEINNV